MLVGEALGPSSEATDSAAVAAAPLDPSFYASAAQQAARCLEVLQKLSDACQVNQRRLRQKGPVLIKGLLRIGFSGTLSLPEGRVGLKNPAKIHRSYEQTYGDRMQTMSWPTMMCSWLVHTESNVVRAVFRLAFLR